MAVVGFGVDTIFVTVKISEVSKYLMILNQYYQTVKTRC